MVDLRLFDVLEYDQIRKLQGGRIRGERLFIAILDRGDSETALKVIRIRLGNQMHSQKPPAFSGGFEPCETCYKVPRDRGFGSRPPRLDLALMKFEVPKLQIIPFGLPGHLVPHIWHEREPAVLLRAPSNSYLTEILEEEDMRFRAGCELRRCLDKVDAETLLTAVELLGATGTKRVVDPRDAVKLFEMQILRVDTRKIEDLIGALRAGAQAPEPTGRIDKAA